MPLPFRGLPFYILCTHGASLSLSRRRHQFLHPYNISQGVPAPMGGILTMHQPHHPKDDWDCGIYPYYWLSLSALKGDGAVMPAHAGCISMAWLSGFMIASAQFGIQQRMLVVLQPCGCAFIFSLPSFLSGIKKQPPAPVSPYAAFPGSSASFQPAFPYSRACYPLHTKFELIRPYFCMNVT